MTPEKARRRKAGRSLDSLETAHTAPERLDAPEPLHVLRLNGQSRRLVVSFAGVGVNTRIVPPPEFTGTASNFGENHALFISDVSRSWMCGPGVADAVVTLIERYRAEHDIEQVVAMGNSMGGFAAIVLAELTRIDCVVAFAPQFSAHPDRVPEEHRWAQLRDRITDWRFLDVGPMDAPGTSYYVIHGDRGGEEPHWARFPRGPQVHHYLLQNAGHSAARVLQKRRRLAPVVNAVLQQRPRRVRRILKRPMGVRYEMHQRAGYEKFVLPVLAGTGQLADIAFAGQAVDA